MKKMNRHEAKVTGDWNDHVYDAEVLSDMRWNGWAIPRFNREQAERIVRHQAELIAECGADAAEPLRWEGDAIVKVSMYEGEPVEYIFPDDEGFFHIGGMEWCWFELPPVVGGVEITDHTLDETGRFPVNPTTHYATNPTPNNPQEG